MHKLNEIFSEWDDRIEPPYMVDTEMQGKYVDCITMLAGLKAKGILEYEYTPADQNYVSHCIYVTWKADDSGFISVKKETMQQIITLFDTMESFSYSDDKGNFWQFMCTIYRSAENGS